MGQNVMGPEDNMNQFYHLFAVDFEKKRVLRPESEKFVLGRAENSDLVISSPKVSDKHCEITCAGNSWLLQNLSPDGTSVVGRNVARDGIVKLADTNILKLGSVYIQCNSEIESAQPPIRVLKISLLIGENCYLSVQDDEHSEAEITENESVQSIEMDPPSPPASVDTPALDIPKKDKSDEMTVEINGIIDNMAVENQHIMQELRETKEALMKALMEKKDLECIAVELQNQLSEYQDEVASKGAIGESVENELQCSICNDLMINVVTLDCSHSFCEFCLEGWKRNVNSCPMCRKNINHECKTRVVDNLINRIMCHFPEDAQQRRNELIESRRGGYH